MSWPLARTFACSLLLLSVCSAQSIAADEPIAVTGVAETLTATATVRAQSRFLAFSDIILPAPTRAPRVAAGGLFAQPNWLMPLPDFSAHAPTIENHSAAKLSPKPKIARPDRTGALETSTKPEAVEQDSEPFGLRTARAPQGLLWVKWRKVQRTIKAEAPALARCRAAASRCSQAAARFIAIVDQAAQRHGRARLELVNQRINYAIRYVSDRTHWHRADVWSAPFDRHHEGTFQTGMGDCEDYAIAKYVALLEAGTPGRDLRLLVVRDTNVRSYHAVLAVRENGQWLLLDNRWRRLIPDNEARFFRPLFALNTAGVERFTSVRVGADNRRAHIKRTAKRTVKMPGKIVLAGELGVTRGAG